jgi:hypothetical protein
LDIQPKRKLNGENIPIHLEKKSNVSADTGHAAGQHDTERAE